MWPVSIHSTLKNISHIFKPTSFPPPTLAWHTRKTNLFCFLNKKDNYLFSFPNWVLASPDKICTLRHLSDLISDIMTSWYDVITNSLAKTVTKSKQWHHSLMRSRFRSLIAQWTFSVVKIFSSKHFPAGTVKFDENKQNFGHACWLPTPTISWNLGAFAPKITEKTSM